MPTPLWLLAASAFYAGPSTPPTGATAPAQPTIINNITSPSSFSWLVPIATLVGALIAASVVLWNEKRKARREDMRQWDKEIRELYIRATHIFDKIYDNLWRAEFVEIPSSEEMTTAEREEELEKRKPRQDANIKLLRMEIRPQQDEFEDVVNMIELIAPKSVHDAFKSARLLLGEGLAPMADGLFTLSQRNKIYRASKPLLPAVRKGLRIPT